MDSQNDHDLLITIHEQVKGIRKDLSEMKDTTKVELIDHETRIRILERWRWWMLGAIALAEGALTLYIALRK